MNDDIQEVVEVVDGHLQDALKHANRYTDHEEVRPSTLMAFDAVNEARKKLDEIDEREWSE